MEAKVLGIDISKRIFQIHGISLEEKVVLKQCLSRDRFIEFMGSLPRCLVGMEACGSSNRWARKLTKLGHIVKLTSPHMMFVAIKSVAQQDIQAIGAVAKTIRFRYYPDFNLIMLQCYNFALLQHYNVITLQLYKDITCVFFIMGSFSFILLGL